MNSIDRVPSYRVRCIRSVLLRPRKPRQSRVRFNGCERGWRQGDCGGACRFVLCDRGRAGASGVVAVTLRLVHLSVLYTEITAILGRIAEPIWAAHGVLPDSDFPDPRRDRRASERAASVARRATHRPHHPEPCVHLIPAGQRPRPLFARQLEMRERLL